MSTSNEHRELSSRSQLWASSPEAIGGTLGGLAGGMPATGERADVEPLLILLGRPPEGVTVDALRLFTRELLGAESDAVADGGGGRVERRALEADLAKLSADELNLAFRRACLQQHPQRADGSLAGLLRVHLAFELVRAVWLRAAAAGGGKRRRRRRRRRARRPTARCSASCARARRPFVRRRRGWKRRSWTL